MKYGYQLSFINSESFDGSVCLIVSNASCSDTICSQISVIGGAILQDDPHCFRHPVFTYQGNPFTIEFMYPPMQYPSTVNTLVINDSIYSYSLPFTQTFAEGMYSCLYIKQDTITGCRSIVQHDINVNGIIPDDCVSSFQTVYTSASQDSAWIISTGTTYDHWLTYSFSADDGSGPFGNFLTQDTSLFVVPEGLYELCVTTLGASGCYSTSCDTIVFGNPPQPHLHNLTVNVQPDFFTGFKVELFKEDSLTGYVEMIEEQVTSWNSQIVFTNLENAWYFVRARRNNALPCFFPTYYENSLTWQGTAFTMPFNRNILIQVEPCQLIDTTGSGLLNGTFTSGDHRISADTSLPEGLATLLLRTSAGEAIAYRQPLNNSDFSFSGLHPGGYQLLALYPGWETPPFNFTISNQSPLVTVNVSNLSGITAIAATEVSSTFLVYPNPTSDVLIVSGEVSGVVRILNSIGILVDQFTIIQGKSKVLETDKWANGTYFIMFSSDQQTEYKRIIKK